MSRLISPPIAQQQKNTSDTNHAEQAYTYSVHPPQTLRDDPGMGLADTMEKREAKLPH